MVNIDRSAPKVTEGTATGQTQSSAGTEELKTTKLPYDFPVTGNKTSAPQVGEALCDGGGQKELII